MAVTKQLCSIPESAFQDCIKDPQKRLKWCIVAEGSYFEDHSNQSVSALYSFLYHLSWNFVDISCISVQKTKLMA